MGKRANYLFLPAAIVVTVACIVSLVGCSGKNTKKAPKVEAKAVQLGRVERQKIQTFLTVTGTVVPVEDVVISPEVSGAIIKKSVDEGDAVTRGDTIAVIDREEFLSRAKQAEATLKQEEVLMAQAERDVKTREPLYKKNVITKDDFANLLSRKQEMDARVERAKAALKSVRIALENTIIACPLDTGIVVETHFDAGEYVIVGQPIARVINLADVYVELQVPEGRINEVALGEEVKFRVSSYGEPFTGKIHAIVPYADTLSRTFKVRVLCHNQDYRLKAGMFAVAEIPGKIKNNAIVVPTAAVKTIGNQHIIYQAMDSAEYRESTGDTESAAGNNPGTLIAKEHKVKIGISFEGKIEIISEIESDMRIVTVGAQSLSDGDPITTKKSDE